MVRGVWEDVVVVIEMVGMFEVGVDGLGEVEEGGGEEEGEAAAGGGGLGSEWGVEWEGVGRMRMDD